MFSGKLVFILPMRNWNSGLGSFRKDSACGFHSTYEELKRRWTFHLFLNGLAVFILPMRNWNSCFARSDSLYPSVFILPMRNWNTVPLFKVSILFPVFILPMRNWNPENDGQKQKNRKGFHSTYEELKQSQARKRKGAYMNVFILPMRNWNSGLGSFRKGSAWFSFYLWGIETLVRPPPQCTHNSVFILPMRNWN